MFDDEDEDAILIGGIELTAEMVDTLRHALNRLMIESRTPYGCDDTKENRAKRRHEDQCSHILYLMDATGLWKDRSMRINVYSQELTDEVIPVEKTSNTGVTYHAAQLVLHSSEKLHHPPKDDDRSAITFWLPKSSERREAMAKAFERIAALFREAPPDSGLD